MPSPAKQARLYRNLYTLLKAGIGISRALETASRNARGPAARACRQMREQIGQGCSLAQAMASHRRVFSPLDVKLIEAGEESGQLAETFEQLSRRHELRKQVRSNIASGLMLPGLILHAAALFAPLPGFVLGTLTVGGYIASALGILAVLYVPLLLVGAVVYLTPPTGPARTALDYLCGAIPLLSGGLLQLAYARYLRVMGMLLAAGVPIRQAAQSAWELCPNARVRNQVRGAAQSVQQGRSFSAGLSPSMPSEYRQGLLVAEESGTLDEAFLRLAELAQEAADRRMTQLSVWLPRLVYLAVVLLLAWHILRNAQMVLEKTGSVLGFLDRASGGRILL
jgi:type II secretory pathway component PulF